MNASSHLLLLQGDEELQQEKDGGGWRTVRVRGLGFGRILQLQEVSIVGKTTVYSCSTLYHSNNLAYLDQSGDEPVCRLLHQGCTKGLKEALHFIVIRDTSFSSIRDQLIQLAQGLHVWLITGFV